MGLLSKAVKKIKGAAKTLSGGRTPLGKFVSKAADNVVKKGFKAFTLGQISGNDTSRAKNAALNTAVAANTATNTNTEAIDAAAAEKARLSKIEAEKTGVNAAMMAKLSTKTQAVDAAAPAVVDPAIALAAEEERKKKAAALAAQQAAVPNTKLGG